MREAAADRGPWGLVAQKTDLSTDPALKTTVTLNIALLA